jgi:hypothetical protein
LNGGFGYLSTGFSGWDIGVFPWAREGATDAATPAAARPAAPTTVLREIGGLVSAVIIELLASCRVAAPGR